MVELQDVKNRILAACKRAGRSDHPELVAVSKFQTVESMVNIYEEGQRIFGENYVQELIDKKNQFNGLGLLDAHFHFIGHLQTNKVKSLLPHVSVIHSVGSVKLLEKINSEASILHKKIGVYFQINIDEEESKSGFRVAELSDLVKSVASCDHLTPLGLMCIPDPGRDLPQAFLRMKKCSEEFGTQLGRGLSMGMSNDFETAIEYGATSLRVGSAIFGERPPKNSSH